MAVVGTWPRPYETRAPAGAGSVGWVLVLLALLNTPSAATAPPARGQVPPRSVRPRVVNIVNFVRGVEPRNPQLDLLAPVLHQIRLAKRHGLPVTFLVQYDALIQPRFVDLLRREQGERIEIGGWFEVVKPLVERAGLVWRGRAPWDAAAHVGSSIGYTPAEREKLVDVFMRDFKSAFGRYPRSVGSWFIDAHTLAYLAGRYDVIASCNCKDQVENDGYTLWGGYWNQAYYPSRKNAFMPAQDARDQIPIPIFRMAGSDPIEQHRPGTGGEFPGILTLEPACRAAGGRPAWVRWYFDAMIQSPCLAFAYAQVGQENSYGWERMAAGLTDQMTLLADLARRGLVRVETLESSGRWFRSRFPVTPSTAVAVLQDVRGRARSSVWFDSRFYRMNVLVENGELRVRDLHLFDQRYEEPFLRRATTSWACLYETLPVMDGLMWSTRGLLAGLHPVCAQRDGARVRMRGGHPQVLESSADELRIVWPLDGGGRLEIRCNSSTLEIRRAGTGGATPWALELVADPQAPSPAIGAGGRTMLFRRNGFDYAVRFSAGALRRVRGTGVLLMLPEDDRLVLDLARTVPPEAGRR